MLLIDQNISFRIEEKLKSVFENSVHVKHVGLNDKPDLEIWRFARKNNYTILTFDSDFVDIAMLNGSPPKIIWLRTGNLTSPRIVELITTNKEKIIDFMNLEEYKNIACLEIHE
ncbi:MAG: DUF5615 family PIN-like protein [Bacteroidetes bacterium]|nr:DUF5615 family PIN-like protein [Bacteroidota bacterium]